MSYDPNRLFNGLIEVLKVSGDRALSRRLRIGMKLIEDMRVGRIPVVASTLIWISQITGVSIQELKKMAGDRRLKCRLPCHIQFR